jgi:hypothetical protein
MMLRLRQSKVLAALATDNTFQFALSLSLVFLGVNATVRAMVMPAIIYLLFTRRRGGEDISMGSSGCDTGANRGSSGVETWPRRDPIGVQASGKYELNNGFCWLNDEKKPGIIEADDDDEGSTIYNKVAMMFEGRKSPRGLLASTIDGGLGSLGSILSFLLIKVVSSSSSALIHFSEG